MKLKYNIWAYFTCLIILFLSMGYALFNDSLSIGATGIIDIPSGSRFNEVILSKEVPTLNSGDGLYSYGSKYYFSGASVDNYVNFNDETWRIVSIESDGAVKIVKDTVVEKNLIVNIENETNFWLNSTNNDNRNKVVNNGKINFDFKGRRYPSENASLTNNYCIPTYNGCNAYAVGTYFDKIVSLDSLMKIYLENVYFQYMTPLARDQVQNYNLNIGIVETNKKIDVVLTSESVNTLNSYIGLLNISDYVMATQDTTCRNSFDKEACVNNNWLFLDGYQFYVLNGKVTSTNAQVWTVTSTGKLNSQDANNLFYLRPVVVLNKDITATGDGSIDSMYQLGDIL